METKPTSFARGVPKSEHNGFYGLEDELIANATGHPIVAVVTYVVDEVVAKELAGERYPIVKILQIEPLLGESAIAAAEKLRDQAQAARIGQDALDLPEDE